jgi:hypothetical protein
MHTIHSRVLRRQNVDRIANFPLSLCRKVSATFVAYLECEHDLTDGYSMRIQANMCIASFDLLNAHVFARYEVRLAIITFDN